MKQKAKSYSVADYKAFKRKKPSKYRSVKVKYVENGKEVVKDSIKEYRRIQYLKELQKEGKISGLKEQVTFVLQENILAPNGKVLERAIKFIIDCTYFEDNNHIAEDIKSTITKKEKSYIIKRKMFRKFYPQYIFREFDK